MDFSKLTNCKRQSHKIGKNDEAVSPIVATLVLIVVAIIGAAAVALIMGSFSSNVSHQVNSGNTANAASTQLTIGGSTTMQPLSKALATSYMNNNTGVLLNVQGGGNAAGEQGVGMNAIDIGSTSDAVLPSTVTAKYPNIQTFTLGGSGVVLIGGSAVVTGDTGANAITYSALKAAYASGSASGLTAAGVSTIYTLPSTSAASVAFANYLGTSASALMGTPVADEPTLLATVIGSSGGLGYIDYGFASSGILPTPATTGTGTYTANSANIKSALQSYMSGAQSSTAYPISLVYPLNYLTNGNPSAIEQAYINFAEQPQNEYAFQANHLYSVYDINS